MLCVGIKGPSFEEALEQILRANKQADLAELRLDLFDNRDLSSIKLLKDSSTIPLIFTLRDKSQGGFYPDYEAVRLEEIKKLASLQPDYFDIENHVPKYILNYVIEEYPKIKIIVSYHNFASTPPDLDNILEELNIHSAHFYKIVTTAQNTLDSLRMLNFLKQNKSHKLIGICMGIDGQITRILGPVFGCPITYASLDDTLQSAPGQLEISKLVDIFHYRTLNSKTDLFGLIGYPLDNSVSDNIHNGVIEQLGNSALYVKMQIKPEELEQFLKFAAIFKFRGLSVTMPLKEAVMPFLDEIDPAAKEIGAVNTIRIENGRLFGYNTDGFGCLNAIEREMSVKRKKVVLIGAGGAAKAIAYEACKRGAFLTILNRDEKRASHLAKKLNCEGYGLEHIRECSESKYDILINATPVDMPIDPKYILSTAIVMDIRNRPKNTPFLIEASLKGCLILYGYQMFVEQGVGQYAIWYKNKLDQSKVHIAFEKMVEMYFA